ncbi:MAG: hypothetical protein A3A58_01640 [Candidatus Blackburnbacteria bacterium RIFCSPLOWO2_01_FULL_41_27]|uniref:Uncharacterized protein n=2 Tax=Candidatus Blackburniibacteriota TaxID=1817898 RepID=A0A1G1V5R1_9BACT|nr:MAG: hypothetical protein A3F61_02350 [Candidatus Blackburnbacteria bacterium RIFCSPHIGHO2_12_FULL_41_13b]OGY14350.1 MAG: hypothetical protein A3A58_01640 [Candidatus Blackburnbacteria bacterium RIFCSPLOWO2_01_FULL_41_27]
MDKKQREEWFEMFGQAFREVMIPVLQDLKEELTNKIEEETERIEDKLDKHTDRMDRHGKKLEDLDERVTVLETAKS